MALEARALALIGTGGMGKVYRATDTNLRREVAIKILPAAFASDADRIARFQREAEALAALNHSNITQIYGLERSRENTALAMELVGMQDGVRRLVPNVDTSSSRARGRYSKLQFQYEACAPCA